MRIFSNPNYNFIKWRWHALIFSIVIIWIGVATIYFKGGIPLGIEFTGGTQVIIQFDKPTGEDVVRRAVDKISKDASVQRFGRPELNQLVIRLPEPPNMGTGGAPIDEDAKRVEDALRAANIGFVSPPVSKDVIGPVMGKDYQNKGIWATVAALGGILLYVAFRFRLTFAVGAIVAAFHDILITLVMLTWFGYDLSLNIIAGILTITGYSVNDTIVVFDRVRENKARHAGEPFADIVNHSILQTFGRSIMTSLTVVLTLLALLLFGGAAISDFILALLIGIISGTYSSIFVAAPLLVDWQLWDDRRHGRLMAARTPRPRRAAS